MEICFLSPSTEVKWTSGWTRRSIFRHDAQSSPVEAWRQFSVLAIRTDRSRSSAGDGPWRMTA